MSASVRTPLGMVIDGADRMDAPILTFVEIRPDGAFAEEHRTYRDLLRNGRQIGGALIEAGIGVGDAFALVMGNHPEFVDAMMASEMVGAIFVPIDPRTRGDSLAYMLRFSKCRGAIIAPEVAANLLPLVGELPDLKWIWVIGKGAAEGCERLETVSGRAMTQVKVAPRPLAEPMQMLFTSGTTGAPKAILSPYARFGNVGGLGSSIGLRPDDRPYTGLSLTHANAQLISLGNALAMGLPLVISRKFTKSRLWEILSRYQCTTFNLLGGMATAIFAEPPGLFDRAHQVRFVLSAGMPASMWPGFVQRFGVEVFELFATAEGGLTLNPPGVGPIGSIGKSPPEMICEIRDEHDQVAAPNVHGEICFQNTDGSVTPVTYFGNPAASAAKTRDGWFRSGDIGWKDEDGWVYFSHRGGQSIRRNGDFIDARQVEATIAELAGVADVYVYGVATEFNAPGEKEIVAAIVAGPGWAGPGEVFTDCARKLGSASAPSFIQLIPEIPKTASEKPQDRHLIAMLSSASDTVFDKKGSTTIQIKERK